MYERSMKLSLVKIGNTRGIRLPKPILEQLGAENSIELEVKSDHLIIRPTRVPRQGWDEHFALMAKRGDDKLPDWDTVDTMG